MITSSRAFLLLLALLSQLTPGSADSVPIVSCTTNTNVQNFKNPSFESGALDNGWTISNVFWGTSSYGVVQVGTTAAQGSAEDGSYYFQTYGTNHVFDLSQTVSNLVVGTTYTITYYNHLTQYPGSLSSCWDSVYLDTTATRVGYFYYQPSTTWTIHTFTFQATATSHTLIFAFDCGSGSSLSWYMGWDNFQIVGETQVCTTTYSTIPTSTPTPTPSSVSSSTVLSTTSTIVSSSSSAVRSSSPTTASSTAAVSSSAVVIPSSTTTASSSPAVQLSSTATVSSSSAATSAPLLPRHLQLLVTMAAEVVHLLLFPLSRPQHLVQYLQLLATMPAADPALTHPKADLVVLDLPRRLFFQPVPLLLPLVHQQSPIAQKAHGLLLPQPRSSLCRQQSAR